MIWPELGWKEPFRVWMGPTSRMSPLGVSTDSACWFCSHFLNPAPHRGTWRRDLFLTYLSDGQIFNTNSPTLKCFRLINVDYLRHLNRCRAWKHGTHRFVTAAIFIKLKHVPHLLLFWEFLHLSERLNLKFELERLTVSPSTSTGSSRQNFPIPQKKKKTCMWLNKKNKCQSKAFPGAEFDLLTEPNWVTGALCVKYFIFISTKPSLKS